MAYIALPNVAWQRLLETRLDDLWTRPARANLCADLVLAHANLFPCPRQLISSPTPKNQPEITSGALFHGHFHVLRWVQ